MRVHRDREGMRIARAAFVAGAVLLAVFLAAAAAERSRLASYQAAWASLERETRLLADWISEWDEPSETEEEAWEAVRAAYERGVSAGETRLSFATELSGLAAETGLADFNLAELPPAPFYEDTPAEDRGGDWENPWEGDGAPAAAGRVERSRYSFEARFTASYRSLVLFLDGLERMPRIVEIRSASIRRGDPRLDVEMVIAAYGRDPDAF